jgi:hypothetical protein
MEQLPFFPEPGKHYRGRIIELIDRWTSSVGMRSLVGQFGGEMEESWTLEKRLSYLLAFSDRWDYRRGNERLEAAKGELSATDGSLVSAAVKDLGMSRYVAPRLSSYDAFLVLGGIATSCRLRTNHAAQTLGKLGPLPRTVALLGSSRPVTEAEREFADEFAPSAQTEFDLLNAAAEQAFDVRAFTDVQLEGEGPQACGVRRYHTEPPVVSLMSPPSQPGGRATTSDTLYFFADQLGVARGDRLLLFTSRNYVPFHLFTGLRSLGLRFEAYIETVGFPTEWVSGAGALRGVNHLLQEVRSGIQAAWLLHEDMLLQ